MSHQRSDEEDPAQQQDQRDLLTPVEVARRSKHAMQSRSLDPVELIGLDEHGREERGCAHSSRKEYQGNGAPRWLGGARRDCARQGKRAEPQDEERGQRHAEPGHDPEDDGFPYGRPPTK